MGNTKRDRSNLSVSATPDVLAQIDELVESSMFDTSRSGVALAAIKLGLPLLMNDKSAKARRKGKR